MRRSRHAKLETPPARPGDLLLVVLLGAMIGCTPRPSPAQHAQVAQPPKAVAVKPFRIANPDLVLLVTGGTNGMLEICNCTGTMPGGLARRSGLAISYRAAFPHLRLLDAGDSFWIDPNDLRNEYVLRGYQTIGYDTLVLGDQELAADPDRLSRMLLQVRMNCLSSTVCPAHAAGAGEDSSSTTSSDSRASAGTAPAWAGKREVTWQLPAGKVAVVSDATREAFLFMPDDHLAKLAFAKSADLDGRVSRLKKDGCVVILVAHLPGDAVEQVAARTQADLVIRGHTARSEQKLLTLSGKPVIKAGGSETVGAAALKIEGGKIADIDYRAELVDEKWPMDQRLIQVYQAYAHLAMRKALDAERTKGLDYIPSGECGICHERQILFWQAGRHAKAYKTLQGIERTGDPNCVACHTTGFGTEKGFYTIRTTPRMAGVNCQSCHRFNVREHRTEGWKPPKVKEDICTTCHTPVTDPKFDYKKKLDLIRCPKLRR